ncbi:putative esterase [Gordonia effusa NBRC 100432]|uniref:Putative esterase n=1 Tax=Gordonia effusa NBRC 100432 TaxID=1077974 RepID=H0QXV9_9ACTN|nr:alpha/beta hydrolase [Gordonia effusa]GAB17660.1 putative esterase [Gordonia effusa NBRC 100432]
MSFVAHRKPSFASYPIWFGARAVLKPLLSKYPLTERGLNRLHLIDKLAQTAPKSKTVMFSTLTLGGRPADLMLPKGPSRRDGDTAVLYLHGGAFVVAGRGTHRAVASRLCERAELPVFSLEYRQLPEGGVGTSVHDAFSAYRELIERRGFRHLVVAGDSAGGFLCGKVIELAAENGLTPPIAFVGIAPLLDLDLASNPDRSSRSDAYLPKEKMAELAPKFDWGPIPFVGTRRITSLDPALFPPTVMITAEDEMIEPDVIELVEKLDAAGVRAELHSYSWQIHAFPVLAFRHREVLDAIEAVASFVADVIREVPSSADEPEALTG